MLTDGAPARGRGSARGRDRAARARRPGRARDRLQRRAGQVDGRGRPRAGGQGDPRATGERFARPGPRAPPERSRARRRPAAVRIGARAAEEAPGHPPPSGRVGRRRRGSPRRSPRRRGGVHRRSGRRGRARGCARQARANLRGADAADRVDRREAELDEQIGSLLAGDENIDVQQIEPANALETLRPEPFDLGVVAVGRPRSASFALIREAATDEGLRELPLIAFVAGGLTKADRARLDAVAKSAVITIADSPERLVDRAALFLHRAEATLPIADPRAARPSANRRRAAARPQGARDRRRHPQRVRAHLDASSNAA